MTEKEFSHSKRQMVQFCPIEKIKDTDWKARQFGKIGVFATLTNGRNNNIAETTTRLLLNQ